MAKSINMNTNKSAHFNQLLCFQNRTFHMGKLIKSSISRGSFAVAAIIFLPFFLGGCQPKDLPLPEHEQGLKTVSGRILNCDIKELGSSGRTIFVGMAIDALGEPYIRINIPREEMPQYDIWCNENADVTITYRAKSTELSPEITYWAEDIEENET